MAIFLGLAIAGPNVTLWLPASILPLLTVVAGGPHYGATLLRAYEREEDRRKYRSVTVFATVALAIVFLVSLRIHLVGSLVATLYLMWSPWHYSGQNYGLMLMFLGRRGIAPSAPLKRWIRASFILSFLLVIVQLNGENPSGTYAPAVQEATSGGPIQPFYRQIPLGIPAPIQATLFWALAIAYLGTLGMMGAGLFRRGSIRDLVPALAIVITQSLWFSLPAIARYASLSFGLVPLTTDFANYTFHYIAAAHAFQYIWVTLYFYRKTHPGTMMTFFYGKSMMAGQLLWGLPALIFAPLMIGSFSFSADLGLLVASTVNIHHFILDGAIWKLRDNRIGRVLMDESPVKSPTKSSARSPSTNAAIRPSGRPWLLPVVLATGALFVVSQIVNALEGHAYASSMQKRDLPRAEQALDRLRWVANDAFDQRRDLGLAARELGDFETAIRSFERSIVLRPSPGAYFEMARVHALREEWDLASDSFEGAYALAPFPPAYSAEFLNSLVHASRRERAVEVLRDELRKFPLSPELGQAKRLFDAGR